MVEKNAVAHLTGERGQGLIEFLMLSITGLWQPGRRHASNS